MTTLETPMSPPETPCRSCSAPLAPDQRYCLNCGARRGDARLPLDDVVEGVASDTVVMPPPPVAPSAPVAVAATGPQQDRTALAVLVIAAIILPAFGLGLLLGGRGDQVSTPAAQVITVGGAAAGGTPVAAATVTDTWPAGKDGWTVQIQALPKVSSQAPAVQAASADATAKGAPAVGTLDSDAYASLPAGDYVVFSGVYDDEAAAKKALTSLKASFPSASVVQVASTATDAADSGAGSGSGSGSKAKEDAAAGADSPSPKTTNPENLSPEEFQKRSKKLPTTTGTGGKPPPKDSKAPGGGSDEDAVTIG